LARQTTRGVEPGPAVDADPTANVIANLQDAVARLDDLRGAEVRRQDDLRTETRKQLRREMKLRAHYDTLLRQAESARLDAIHTADDKAASRVEAIQAASQASLQRQVSQSRSSNQFSITTAVSIAVALISLIGLVILIIVKG
jgi:hypothetical protein